MMERKGIDEWWRRRRQPRPSRLVVWKRESRHFPSLFNGKGKIWKLSFLSCLRRLRWRKCNHFVVTFLLLFSPRLPCCYCAVGGRSVIYRVMLTMAAAYDNTEKRGKVSAYNIAYVPRVDFKLQPASSWTTANECRATERAVYVFDWCNLYVIERKSTYYIDQFA